MSGLTWGYFGEGPYGLFEVMGMIDSGITYEQIEDLEWPGTYPIMFENVEGRLILKPITNFAANLLRSEIGRLPLFPS